MKNPQLSLKDRVIIRILTRPECLRMEEFSVTSSCGTTFCLAGLICDECGVSMRYRSNGVAMGLAPGETPPAQRWIRHEMSLSDRPVGRLYVLIAAKARELWAAEYGEKAAKLLLFYAPEWGVAREDLDQVDPMDVVDFLQVVNEYAATLPH